MSLDAQKLTDLLTALASFNAAIRGRLDGKLDINAVAFDSNKLGGKTLAEVQALIGDAAAADLAALNAEFEAFIARQDNPHNVTKAQVGLGNVDNFGTATNPEAVAGVLTNKFLTPANLQAFWADKVGTAPETLDTIQELAAALQNNPDALTALQQIAGANQAAIAQLQTDLAAALVTAANDATTKANAAQAAAIAAAAADATAKADAAEADANAYTDGREAAIRTDLASGLASKLGKTEQAVDSAKLEGKTKAEIIAEAQAGVDLSQVVLKSDDFGQYNIAGQTLTAILLAIRGGSTESLQDLRDAIDEFVANKATTGEAVAGTDNSKYVTALGVKAAVDAAINGVVDGAPAALDTLKELADALANQEDAVAALVTVIDTKLNQAQVQAEIAAALVPVDARIDALEAAVGEGSNFLEAGESDLGLNPVALATDVTEVYPNIVTLSDRGTAYAAGRTVRATRNEGVDTIEIDIAQDNSGWTTELYENLPELTPAVVAALDAIPAVDGTTYYWAMGVTLGEPVEVVNPPRVLKVILDALIAANASQDAALTAQVQTLHDRIGNEVASLNAAIQGVINGYQGAVQGCQDAITATNAALNNVFTQLDGRLDNIEAELPNKLDATSNLDTNTVTFPDADTQEPTQQALNSVLEQLRLAVENAESGAATDLAALQTAFNNFVAAKATTAEVIAGTDDAKYTTSLSVKGAIDAAIADLVGTAPEALNTINELAAALNNDPDIINTLMTQIGTKLDATAQAADSAKLQGRTIADLTASNQDVIDGTSTDKFVTPAALSIKQNAQDAAIAANTASISELMVQLAAAFDAAADDLDPVTP